MKPLKFLLLASVLTTQTLLPVQASPGHAKEAGAAKKEQKAWGIAGDAKAVTRTIEVRMSDKMRFTPDLIEVREGQTVRFVHRNDGKALHEFVLGTREDLQKHAALMRKFPGMEHDEPYMAHVRAGKRSEIVWTFNRPGDFDFACLIPGHYEAGMVGRVKVIAQDQVATQ